MMDLQDPINQGEPQMTTTSVSSNTNSTTSTGTGTNGLAVASLVTGILSLVFCWGGWLFAGTAAAAIYTGIKANRGSNTSRGVATAGTVLGVIAACMEFLLLVSVGHP
jgi:hypothetical protein